MYYAKQDIYLEDPLTGRRFQAAFAGQLVPKEYEALVDTSDVTEIATPGEAPQAPIAAPAVEEPAPVIDPGPVEEPATADLAGPIEHNATAAALELAQVNNIDLAGVLGSGRDGRIEKSDVQKLIAADPAA